MKFKSKDIAKALGLSEATVSLVLNERPGVSDKTRKKVLAYIREKENAYFAGQYSQQGKENGKKDKGLILMLQYIKHGIIFDRPGTSVPDYFEKLRKMLKKEGYQFLFVRFDERIHDLDEYMDEWKRQGLKGIYLMGAEMNKHDILYFSNIGVPIVVGDNNFYDMGIDSYLIDNAEGIGRCVDYLVDCGHSDIIYLAESIEIFNFVERREGFLNEMEKRGCGDAKNRIVPLGKTFEEAREKMLEYLERASHRTTAYILESSLISLGAMQALLESHIRIPRDISLIGFDAVPPVSLSDLELTIVKGTHTRRHTAAIKHLLRRIEDEETEIIRVYYRTRLQEGNSIFDKTRFIYT